LKHCPTCNTHKPLDDFYADRRTPDGKKSQCKRCHTAGNVRTRDPERKRIANAIHMAGARAINPEKFRLRERARHRPVDEKVLARRALNNAVKRGAVVKPAVCDGCHQPGKLHGHHADYSQPLKVRWLCPPCHALEHRQ